MTVTDTSHLKKEIIETGMLLWEKNLVSGLNGNISQRIDDETFVITGHKTCLGFLKESDMISVDNDGRVVSGGKASSETLMHSSIYRERPEVKCILHTHTTYTNAYFCARDELEPRIFEAKLTLGRIKGIEQTTPSVTDPAPVLEALKNSNIAVLRHHGVLSVGNNLFDCFLLIQLLEDAAKVDVLSRLYERTQSETDVSQNMRAVPDGKKFGLFSKEQVDAIVELVNGDLQMREMGEKTGMTMVLAVKMNETGEVYSFRFENGRIEEVGHDENAEFLISAPASVWRAVFKREIDPFVATTQKKMDLKGDFARISQWYAPCNRIFELWTQIPVE